MGLLGKKAKNDLPEKRLGLYLHIPFCEKKCDYCDFYSVTGFTDFERYADALMLEIEDNAKLADGYVVDTIYIGGGTPTVMPIKQMKEILYALYANFNVDRDAEVTIEANPATVDKRSLKKLLKAGVNRLSLGLQSTDNEELRLLSRIHTFEDFEDAFYDAREAGFENINVDLMYGIPGQTESSLYRSVEKICDMEPEHISLYGLKIEDGTPFGQRRDLLELPDEDTEYRMYGDSVRLLIARGYKQYEISNFALEGCQSRHNYRYWMGEEYIGIGPGAHSFFGGTRYSNKKDVALYMEGMEYVNKGINLRENETVLTDIDRMNEFIMLRLRTNNGLNADEFSRAFGVDFTATFADRLPLYLDNGFMRCENGWYRFTTKGRYVSNYILANLMLG